MLATVASEEIFERRVHWLLEIPSADPFALFIYIIFMFFLFIVIGLWACIIYYVLKFLFYVKNKVVNALY